MGCIQEFLASEDCACGGWVTVPYAELCVAEEDKHLWSPRLAIYVEDTPGGAHLHCRLQPAPEVWTFFLALYAVSGIAFMSAAFYGYSQWTIDKTPWAALGMPIAALMALGLYLGALAGQRMGHDQMDILRAQLERSLDAYDIRHVETT